MSLYPLEPPNGWFLLKMEHLHTPIRYAADVHEPVNAAVGAWSVQFQKYPKGGHMIQGRGHTMEHAWQDACNKVFRFEQGEDD